jgi:hypothetical protein
MSGENWWLSPDISAAQGSGYEWPTPLVPGPPAFVLTDPPLGTLQYRGPPAIDNIKWG